ncbi:MAG: RluA family pseudouridine synthase [Candidatus Sumerlaeales bacterium]|nr:RluA family pseudouridine synthase [Candidatus Sumerlaeales bacterium]
MASENDAVLTFCVPAESDGIRLDVYLSSVTDLSRNRVQSLISDGHVMCGGVVVERPKRLIRAGETVTVELPSPVPASPIGQDIPLSIVYEDSDIIVVDKPAGMVVHPGAGTPDGTMVNALLGRSSAHLSTISGVFRPGIVHRLDKDTSGLLVVARNDASHRVLSEALSQREIHRVYHAIVLRPMKDLSGKVDLPIGRHPYMRTKMSVVDVEHGGREALTHWHVLRPLTGFTYVECKLSTGRTHQIRVHLSQLKHPVLGDDLYGGGVNVALQLVAQSNMALRTLMLQTARRQMLHARYLSFAHPRTGESMQFEAALPEDFSVLLEALSR